MTREELINKIQSIASKVLSQVRQDPEGESYIEEEDIVKFPELREVIISLFTNQYPSFIEDIDWISPRPSTFRVNLKNNQFFYLIYNKRSWVAQIEGKKYYLLNLPEEERAAEAITRILSYGKKEEEGEEDFSGGEMGGGEIGGEIPAEIPTEEPSPEETPET